MWFLLVAIKTTKGCYQRVTSGTAQYLSDIVSNITKHEAKV
jgi:hypothetical protein